MHDERLLAMLRRHEGLRLHPYTDTVGRLTIGYGRNLDDRGITKPEAELLLVNDATDVRDALLRRWPAFGSLDTVRAAVLVDMGFMGVSKVLGFARMLAALERRDFAAAAAEMLDSKWSRQVGGRATELAQMMRSGAWGDRNG